MKISVDDIFDRDTIIHLRIPFSLFLFPVFCFAVSQSPEINWVNTLVIFVALHFFIYPGSNVYNSYMDEDKGSIGGLEKPPP
ncbi:MAG: 1,4-dihydroxy-2-naphthoate octaprenyltransferase, partial [Bacteroidota bacterium]|nr:1,4-dihydroxy-2-naphthoate octaprenyltransferase [Bacteroidota bacterium]